MSRDLSKIKPTMQSVYIFQLPRDVLYLHNDHIQAQNKHAANGVLFEAAHLQWRCCVHEISFLITSHQLTNELGNRMGRNDNNKKMFDCYWIQSTSYTTKNKTTNVWQHSGSSTTCSHVPAFTKTNELLCYHEDGVEKSLRSVSNICSHCYENHKPPELSQE
jgi:hypothetical protein